jgi:hypothetical protein
MELRIILQRFEQIFKIFNDYNLQKNKFNYNQI